MIWRTPSQNTWNPWSELSTLHREMDRMFDETTGWRGSETGGFPAVNIWTNDDQALLTAEIPGVDPGALEITVKDNAVTLKGNRELPAPKDGETQLRQERGGGAFSRTFTLPFRVNADDVKADYNRGILELTLPRAEQDKPRRIAVKSEA